jgi:hypothetical protein
MARIKLSNGGSVAVDAADVKKAGKGTKVKPKAKPQPKSKPKTKAPAKPKANTARTRAKALADLKKNPVGVIPTI